MVSSDIRGSLSLPHGSLVNLMAVVASVGPVTPSCMSETLATREICIKDSRFGFIAITLFVYFLLLYSTILFINSKIMCCLCSGI